MERVTKGVYRLKDDSPNLSSINYNNGESDKIREDAEFKRYKEIELTEGYGASHFVGNGRIFML